MFENKISSIAIVTPREFGKLRRGIIPKVEHVIPAQHLSYYPIVLFLDRITIINLGNGTQLFLKITSKSRDINKIRKSGVEISYFGQTGAMFKNPRTIILQSTYTDEFGIRYSWRDDAARQLKISN
ncbi:hypothetical protein [Risungbinella massiliensis]|uniref:hypothetical protein n=1 Tax=Risungbinella massiliensis TaxID=1329796 RepID=UPI0005CC60BB|nr:hypothetical protein [Risungbinella massiliensis]